MVQKKRKKRFENEEQVKLEEKTRDSVVVLPATQSKCLQPGMMQLFRTVVKEANKAHYMASHLANAHFTRLLNFGTIGTQKPDQDFYYLCICLVSGGYAPTRRKAEECGLMDTYEELWETQQPVAPATSHWSIPRYAAINMATVAENYNTVALFDHIPLYIRAKYGLELKGHAKYITNIVKRNQEPADLGVVPVKLRPLFSEQALWNIVREERRLFWQAWNSGDFLNYRWMMLQVIHQQSTDELSFKGFTLLPVRSMGPKFIDMDIQAMRGLWSRLKPCSSRSKSNTPEELEALAEWQRIHDEGALWDKWLKVPKKGPGWVLGKVVRTNGYEFHYLFEKNKARGPKRAKKVPRSHQLWETDWDPVYTFNGGSDNIDPATVVGVDPGNANIITGARPTGRRHENGTAEFEKYVYTKRKYNHHSKRNAVNKLIKNKNRSRRVQEELQILAECSIKTPSWEKVKLGVQIRTLCYDFLWQVYGSAKLLKLKAAARMAEKRTIDKLVNWITGQGRYTVGWGDCSRTTGIAGTSAGGPVRKIRRHAVKKGRDICLVREPYTSKRSCCCRGHDLSPVRTAEGGQIHGLRTCQGCGKTWDRDFSAAINIWDVYWFDQIQGGDRPWNLTKENERPVSGNTQLDLRLGAFMDTGRDTPMQRGD